MRTFFASATRRLWLAALATGCAVAALGFRLLGTRSARGAHFDRTAVQDGLAQLAEPRVAHATAVLLDTISFASLAVVGAGLIAYALSRRRLDLAAASVVLLVGANATTQLLKGRLGVRADAGPGLANSFPSGHATVAMSIALAVLLVAPARLRFPVAVIGALYATAIGVALVVTGWHYPSDVGGGFCVAGAWAAVAALTATRPSTGAPSARAVLGLGALGAAAVGIAVVARPQAVVHVQLHLRLAEAAAGIAAVAAAVVAAFAYAIAARNASTTRSWSARSRRA